MTRRMGIAGLISVLLHGLIAAALLLRLSPKLAGLPEPPDKPVTVELVMEEQKGTGKTQAAPPAQQQQTQQAPPADPSPPLPADPAHDPTPVPPPSEAQKAQPAPPQPQLKIRIGGNDDETNSIVLPSESVIPASPTSDTRNRQPDYPEDAAIRGQYGNVKLIIHVSAAGRAVGVDIAESSGVLSLDRAAVEAVRTWRFLPALKDGKPVPFDLPFGVNFALD